MKKILTLPGIMLFVFIFTIIFNINGVKANDLFDKNPRFKVLEQLSEEQREAVKSKVKELFENGTSREEIRKQVREMISAYGIEIPEHPEGFMGSRKQRPGRKNNQFFDNLTDEQRKALREKVSEMRKAGANREEIHETVKAMLGEYGIEIPEQFGKHRQMWKNLSDEQRQTLRKRVREMRENGDSREEIREAVQHMLKEFGADPQNETSGIKWDKSGENLSIRSYPNPFNPETNIEYNIKSTAQVGIKIYDVQGKLVRSLGSSYRQAGSYTTRWNGLNENGIQVPSGVYFIKISAGEETINHRIVMMK